MTAPLVKKRRYRGKPLPDGFNIDHQHNIWYDLRVVNQCFTLSKVDSRISRQALSMSIASSGARNLPTYRAGSLEARTRHRLWISAEAGPHFGWTSTR